MNNDITIKLKRDLVEALQGLIVKVLSLNPIKDADKLHGAVLSSLHLRLQVKLCKYNKQYSIKLSSSEAIALRMLYTFYYRDATTYLGNRLHQISNQVHKQFS